MDNAIYFYQLPFVYGGITQPYFMSDTARDNWFNKYQSTQVNGNGVSIKLAYNYELEVVVDVDITNISNFNFAIIKYNGKKYYANIIDSELVSVNKSRVMLLRNPLFERTNYLQYFTDFKITKSTFSSISYSDNSKFFIPKNFRTKQTQYSNFPITSFHKVIFFNFMLLYLTNLNPELSGSFSNTDVVSNYTVLAVPVDSSVTFTDSDKHFVGYDAATQARDIINKASPYLLRYEFIKLPCFLDTYYIEGEGIKDGYNIDCAINKVIDSSLIGVTCFRLDSSRDVYEYTISFSYNILDNPSSLFNILHLFIGSDSNELVINFSDYCDGQQINLNIIFNYIFTIDGTQISLRLEGPKNSILGQNHKPITYPLFTSVGFNINSEALFNAQNRYYQALTSEATSAMSARSAVQSSSQILAGTAELVSGPATGGGVNSGSLALGVGNIIRGIATFGTNLIDTNEYENTRKYLARQEKERPNNRSNSLSQPAQAVVFKGLIYGYIETITEQDLSVFLNDGKTYGIDCYCSEVDFDFAAHTYSSTDGSYFFLAAIAVLKHPSTLTTREYSELYRLLKNGLRYEQIN